MLRRVLVLAYGTTSYALFLLTLLYTVGFVGGFITPTRLDDPRDGPLPTALAIDLGLLALFALQHSGMARPAFKRRWTRFVPEALERSTYVLLSAPGEFPRRGQSRPGDADTDHRQRGPGLSST